MKSCSILFWSTLQFFLKMAVDTPISIPQQTDDFSDGGYAIYAQPPWCLSMFSYVIHELRISYSTNHSFKVTLGTTRVARGIFLHLRGKTGKEDRMNRAPSGHRKCPHLERDWTSIDQQKSGHCSAKLNSEQLCAHAKASPPESFAGSALVETYQPNFGSHETMWNHLKPFSSFGLSECPGSSSWTSLHTNPRHAGKPMDQCGVPPAPKSIE